MKNIIKFIAAGVLGLLGFTLTAGAAESPAEGPSVEPIKMVAPTIPQEYDLGEVEVDVFFNLNAQGEPINIRAANSPTFAYALSAKRAVSQWRFAVDENADLSDTEIRLPVVFSYEREIG